VGLVAGMWVDRLPRRPILIAADLGRAALLGSIPAAAYFGALHIHQLYIVAFLSGVLSMFFDVAYTSYLPSLVQREELVEGNSKLSASASVAEVGAFSLGGWLVQVFSGPVAVLIDAVSFLVSALFVALIRVPEPPPPAPEKRPGVWEEITGGLRAILESPVLRSVALGGVIQDFSGRIFGTVFLLYVSRELGFKPGVLGVIWAVGGVTSLLGAWAAGPVTRRLGLGRTLILGLLLAGVGQLFIPMARDTSLFAVALMVASQLVSDPAYTIYSINETSLRQSMTPDRLLGRVDAGIRFAGLGAMLAGAFGAGYLGERIGLQNTLLVGAGGTFLAALWLAVSPVRHLKTPPAHPSTQGLDAGVG